MQTNQTGRNKTATGKNLGQTEKKKNVAKRLLEFKEEWEKYGREKIILLQKQQCTLCNLIYFHWGKRVDSDVQKPEMESRVLRAALLH